VTVKPASVSEVETWADEPAIVEHRREGFLISTDRKQLDVDVIHDFLTNCYWAKGIPRYIVARVISDFATIAYVGDVFVLETHRGRGLGKWLMECIVAHPELQGLRRWILTTRDAHGLYSQVGFTPVKWPERFMELFQPGVYETQD
jgi:GNAT superfamily N-acetyltransferase